MFSVTIPMNGSLWCGTLTFTISCQQRKSDSDQLVVSPVSLPDSAHRRQLAHQEFEDGGFTGSVLTNLRGNTGRVNSPPIWYQYCIIDQYEQFDGKISPTNSSQMSGLLNTLLNHVIRVHNDTYDAYSRLEVGRQVESGEEPLIRSIVKLHLVQLQDRRRQLLKVIWKPAAGNTTGHSINQ